MCVKTLLKPYVDIFEAVSVMVENLPDDKLKGILLKDGRNLAFSRFNNYINSIDRWEDMLTPKEKDGSFWEEIQYHKKLLEPIDTVVKFYLLLEENPN